MFALSVHYSLTPHLHNLLLLLWWWLRLLHIPEHLPVHDIGRDECGRWLAMQRRVGYHHGNLGMIWRDVELPLGKYQGGQVDCEPLEGLPLGFVDGHGKGGPHRGLPSTEDERSSLVPNPASASVLSRPSRCRAAAGLTGRRLIYVSGLLLRWPMACPQRPSGCLYQESPPHYKVALRFAHSVILLLPAVFQNFETFGLRALRDEATFQLCRRVASAHCTSHKQTRDHH
jgi:hypothetical protein